MKQIDFITNKILLNRKKIIIFAAIPLIVVVSILFMRAKNNSLYELAVVERRNIIQEISATGKVNPAKKIELQFKNSGKLVYLNAKIGNKTYAGKVLAQQDTKILSAQLAQTQAQIEAANAQLGSYHAALEAQVAKLDELKRGTRSEEIRIAETKVANAEIILNDARKNLIDKLQDAYTKSDDAIRNKIDQFFNNPQAQSPKLIFTLMDLQQQLDIEFGRLSTEYNLKQWKNSIVQLSASNDLTNPINLVQINLQKIKTFLDQVSIAINNPNNQSVAIAQAVFNSWKIDVSTARANINIAINNVSDAEASLSNAQANLILAKNQLSLSQAGTAQEQIRVQEAQVKQAQSNIAIQQANIKELQASILKTKAQIQEMILTSPAKGIISEVNSSNGEIINPGKIVIVIIPSGNLQIDVNISETDIIDVEINQKVKITLDAFSNDVNWSGKVIQIEPAEITVGSAIYYKTTIFFDKQDEKIKPGMTANIWIKTNSKENVLVIPAIAIKEKMNKKYVEVLQNREVIRRDIKTGLRGTDGTIEIISGLKEGDKVIISNIKK